MVYICFETKPIRMNIPRLKALFFLACTCLMTACQPPQPEVKTVAPAELQGSWTLSHGSVKEVKGFMEDDNNYAYSEWSPYDIDWPVVHLHFSGDSMEVFSYPLEYHESFTYEIKGDKVLLGPKSGARTGDDVVTIRVDQDSLWRINTFEIYQMTGHFYRDTLDPSTLAMLRKDSINADALLGRWRLDTVVSVDYDEDYVIDLPFDIPETLTFSEKDIENVEGRVISVKVNSKPRPFRIGYEGRYRIWLNPDGWYSEGLPPIEYRKEYFISLLEDIGIEKVEEIKKMEIAYASDLGTLVRSEEDNTGKTIKSTENPAEISKFTDLLGQLSRLGTGKTYRRRKGDLKSWRIRFVVDSNPPWRNILFIGKKIETSYGSPGEYYIDQKNIALEAELYALMEAFMEGDN